MWARSHGFTSASETLVFASSFCDEGDKGPLVFVFLGGAKSVTCNFIPSAFNLLTKSSFDLDKGFPFVGKDAVLMINSIFPLAVCIHKNLNRKRFIQLQF